ncbi:hypothetical protein DK37_07415 [Halomonas sp. SUBG004]|jgi:hypothetical protein|nr:hypothetical protein DK37_07415 [Halomonas sp. SUBG004]
MGADTDVWQLKQRSSTLSLPVPSNRNRLRYDVVADSALPQWRHMISTPWTVELIMICLTLTSYR